MQHWSNEKIINLIYFVHTTQLSRDSKSEAGPGLGLSFCVEVMKGRPRAARERTGFLKFDTEPSQSPTPYNPNPGRTCRLDPKRFLNPQDGTLAVAHTLHPKPKTHLPTQTINTKL